MVKQGTLKTVVGDVTTPQRTKASDLVVITHCCNNIGVMGAGVALAIRMKWPEVEKIYREHCSVLGAVSYYFSKTEDNVIDLIIANMIGQEGIASPKNLKPIKYYAIMQTMEKVFTFCDSLKINECGKEHSRDVVIHTPEFGGLRAGGNFDFILELIKELWVDRGLDVVIYKFEE